MRKIREHDLYNITVVGAGYVGLANAVFLASKNYDVTLLDIDEEKCNMINQFISPIKDSGIQSHFDKWKNDDATHLFATVNKVVAYKEVDYVIICVPTNFDEETGEFNTSIVKGVIQDIINYYTSVNNDLPGIIIKSTVPVGFISDMRKEFSYDEICFVPEFLQEGHAFNDVYKPSRVILGSDSKDDTWVREDVNWMFNTHWDAAEVSSKQRSSNMQFISPVLITGSKEAEAIKLFSNTYLANRVSFFNELDTFAQSYKINTEDIIQGMSYDPRIRDGYNNPSFGYGGYCLPKDSKQLLSQYKKLNIPQNMISAIVESNDTRKEFVAEQVKKLAAEVIHNEGILFPTIGIYKVGMKAWSDNTRESATIDIMESLNDGRYMFVVYDDNIDLFVNDAPVCHDLDTFIKTSDIIIANRIDGKLAVKLAELNFDKVYTCDVNGEN